ncbi:hypothetical protein ACFPIJ_42270 [Dactylosporangium cerinum]|uniref:Bacterial transcriptional activator domain-containing protein n=1 Tax=Dactylosporangium cerinum TaxID=1434730 RepID=A0ABV9WB36_9ACTN
MGRLIRVVGAAVAALAALVGLPATLVVFQRAVEWDWPLIVAQPLSPGGLAAAGVGVGWLFWLLLLRSAVLDAVDVARRAARAPRLPVPVHTAVTAAASGLMLAVDALRGGTQALHLSASSTVAESAARDPDSTRPPAATDAPRTRSGAVPAGVPPIRADPPANAVGPAASSPHVGGVAVPGGWLPLPVLMAVGAAAGALWVQRRRTYRPRPPVRAHRTDADLAPASETLQRLTRLARSVAGAADALARTGVDTDLATASGTAGHVGRSGSPTDALADLPTDGTGFEDLPKPGTVLADALPSPGVGLIGPGAHDAARGLLVALSTDPHHRAAPVTVPADVLQMLLGPGCVGTNSPRLHVTKGPPVRDVDGAVLHVGAPPDGLDAPDQRPANGGSAPWPWPPRTSAAAETGRNDQVAGTRVIRLGAWPAATTWFVAGDGTVRVMDGAASGPRRVAVLSSQTARSVLNGLGLITTPTTPPPTAAVPGVLRADGPTAAVNQTGAVGDIAGTWPRTPPAVAHMPRRLQVRVLGRPVVLRPYPDGSTAPVVIRRSAGRQILLMLAVHRDPVSADMVKKAVWPDEPGTAVHRRYLTTMSELRLALVDAAGQPVLLQSTNTARPGNTRYWLDPDTVDVDLWRLHDLLDAADSTVETAGRLLLLRQAADLCHGELAEGSAEEWLTVEQERLARHALDLRVHLADLEPDHGTAVRLLRRALRDAPGNESVHRRLLLRHAAAGDADGLRRAAATLTEHLTAAGIEPEPDTVQVIAAVLADAADAVYLPATAASAPMSTASSPAARGTVERSRQ